MLLKELHNKKEHILLFLIVTLAIVSRCLYLGSLSLWIDEAWVSNLIIRENWVEAILNEKEPYWSPLPYLFALSEKLAVNLLGKSEISLRLIPCLFSIMSIPVVVSISKKIDYKDNRTKNYCQTIFLLVVLFNPNIINYSAQAKQFSGLFFFASLIFLNFINIVKTKKIQTNHLIMYFLSALFGSIYSVSLNIFIVVVTVFVFLEGLKKNCKMTYKIFFPLMLFAAGIAIVHYTFWLSPQLDPEYATRTWAEYWYPPDSAGSTLKWLIHRVASFYRYDFEYNTVFYSTTLTLSATILLSLLGLFTLIVSNIKIVLVYVSVLLVHLILSFASYFPFGGSRLTLYLILFHGLFISVGVATFLSRLQNYSLKQRYLEIVTLLFVVAIIFPFDSALHKLSKPKGNEEMRPLVGQLYQFYNSSIEAIYVYWGAIEAFRFYWPNNKNNNKIDTIKYGFHIQGKHDISHLNMYVNDVDLFINSLSPKISKVHFIFTHVGNSWKHEMVGILEYAEKKIGTKPTTKEFEGAWLYTFCIK